MLKFKNPINRWLVSPTHRSLGLCGLSLCFCALAFAVQLGLSVNIFIVGFMILVSMMLYIYYFSAHLEKLEAQKLEKHVVKIRKGDKE